MAGAPVEETYTPEQLNEIERIVNFVSSSNAPGRRVETPVSVAEDKPYTPIATGEYHGEPEDLDLPRGRLDNFVEEEMPSEAAAGGKKGEELDNVTQFLTEVEDIPLEEPEAAEDITSILKEVPETEVVEKQIEEPIEMEESEESLESPISAPPAKKRITPGMTPLQQLEAITEDEPPSLDAREIMEPEEFRDKGGEIASPEIPASDEAALEEPQVAGEAFDLADLETGPQKKAEMKIEGGIDDFDSPALEEISLEEAPKISEADTSELGEFDLDQLPEGIGSEMEEFAPIESEERKDIDSAPSGKGTGEIADEIGEEELGTLHELGGMQEGEEDFSKEKELHDFDLGPSRPMDEGLGPMIVEEHEALPADDILKIEKFEDEIEEKPKKPKASKKAEAVELSERDLRRFKEKILRYDPALRSAVKNVIINDVLPPRDAKQLVDMIVSGRSETDVLRYLEKKLGKTITLTGAPAAGRRVISSRPEYSREGRERQKKLLAGTKIAAVAALSAFIFTILGWQFIYKPYRAKQLVKEGVALILKKDAPDNQMKNFNMAEELLKKVNENYIDKYIFGEIEYGRAYLKRKEYNFSLKHLNTAYSYEHKNKDVLNNLGYFYSRVNNEYYMQIKPSVREWYFKGRKVLDDPTQLDLAIDFFQRVLSTDPKNITALHGIGNAYFNQKQYLKAKRYYENILKLDPNSVVGLSGLLNLYIDRDAFEQVVTIHSRLNNKKKLTEIPSPLLAKLISYYLGKQKTDTRNVRIDYGMTSPRFIDEKDNIYPAIQSVITALNKKDPNYPPLYIQTARFSKAQKNYKLMKRHLDKALSLEPNYFAALSMTGEYYFFMRDPVRAFEYLRKAIKAHPNPPDFTDEDFYEETEKLGRTYALMGNVFYYYFDRLDRGKIRFGDLEDDLREQQIEGDIDRMANYNIARSYYEAALEVGDEDRFESPELRYNLGRICYLNGEYKNALDQWLNLYDDFVSRPELMLALGNAFYHNGNYEASKGEYLKLISVFERDADNIKTPIPGEERFIRLYQSLSTAYNNLGVVYQVLKREQKSNISYWKAIDYAKRIDVENEFARVNLARATRMDEEDNEAIMDENIPFSLDIYREDMRK